MIRRMPMCQNAPTTGFITFEKLMGQMSARKGDTKIVNFASLMELEKVLMVCVDWYLKVSILQIQFYHPIHLLDEIDEIDEIGECVQSLNFEMFMFHEHVSAFRFITSLWPPSFFSTRKICDTKLPWEGVVSTTAPLDNSSLISVEIILLSSTEQFIAGIGLSCQDG